MSEEKLKIYVCCHKDYEDVGINNSCYKIITCKDIKNNSSLEMIKIDSELDDRMWSELASLYHIWKHPELQAEYIGLCHYRRYFDFMNDVPTEFDKPIIPKRLGSAFNNYITYDLCHNSKDLFGLMRIIHTDFKDYSPAMRVMSDSHFYFPYNMFIFSKELFNTYCEFLFGALLNFDEKIGVKNDYNKMIQHIADYREFYVERDSYPNNTYEYQARLYGFLAERMSTAFIMKYIHEHGEDSINETEVTITEKTYNKI